MMRLILTLAIASLSADDKAALSGVVHSEKGGPIEGASVRVWTAGPRKGPGDL
jgi:protocatechuate 3,4-dioxygenase beta subunit